MIDFAKKIITIISVFYLNSVIAAANLIDIEFNYKEDSVEKQIAIDYLKRQYKNENFTKDKIGIFSYDIDNDNKDEIFVYLTQATFCGSGGCPLYILKTKGDTKQKHKYYPLKWKSIDSQMNWILTPKPLYVLNSTNNGFKDITILIHSEGEKTYKWKKSYYEIAK